MADHDHHHHSHHDEQQPQAQHADHTPATNQSLNDLALAATLHCLTGCGIGVVLGMVIGTWAGWGNGPTMVLAIVLAFIFGYALTMRPLLRSGMAMGQAVRLALAADTVSITVMEIIDNAVLMLIPGAMMAGLGSWLFWGSLAIALVLAAIVGFPVNRWLIARGKGHAVVHKHHH